MRFRNFVESRSYTPQSRASRNPLIFIIFEMVPGNSGNPPAQSNPRIQLRLYRPQLTN
jgi:hypothetical protein